MLPSGSALHGNHIETQAKSTPFTVRLQKVAGSSNDFALLAPVHRLERSAEVGFCPLPDFYNDKYPVLAGDDVEFSGFAAQVTRQHLNTSQLQMADGERFAVQPAPHACVGHEGSVNADGFTTSHRGWP